VRRVRITSEGRNAVLIGRCAVAESTRERTVGLLGREGLADDEGLWIAPCNSIHTWFMRFAIDVVFLDREDRVLRVAACVPPFRMRLHRHACSVVELPAGRAATVGIVAGERLASVSIER
jgi:uncharacterized membrane protein (UPF0127 family)